LVAFSPGPDVVLDDEPAFVSNVSKVKSVVVVNEIVGSITLFETPCFLFKE
jgi:hypothetical protein